ncbi:MAG TPA: YecR family lipoprotein [Rhizomicrobium sp.]|nr:YecR family lipoprotein [Rhizomicrobium sp.]
MTVRLLIIPAILAAILPALASCADGRNSQYKTVTVSYTYSGNDKQAREWRAFMDALDSCHLAGYQDALPADPPQQRCKVGDENNCSVFEAARNYECVGLGYQTF